MPIATTASADAGEGSRLDPAPVADSTEMGSTRGGL
jgi:hypothetical protein